MSGGSMNYLYSKIEWYADFELTTPNRVAFAKHLQLVARALHDIEWVDSGDYSPGEEDQAILAVIADRCGEVCDRAKLCATCAGSLEHPEPVAWWDDAYVVTQLKYEAGDDWTPLYTHPPRREWRGLTEEEIYKCFPPHPDELAFARNIEAALKERNT